MASPILTRRDDLTVTRRHDHASLVWKRERGRGELNRAVAHFGGPDEDGLAVRGDRDQRRIDPSRLIGQGYQSLLIEPVNLGAEPDEEVGCRSFQYGDHLRSRTRATEPSG